MLKDIKFPKNRDSDFIVTLRNRVSEHFKSNNISRYGDVRMVLKTVVMLLLYFIPYTLMMTGVVTHTGVIFVMWVLMGLGMAGIGLSVMHDANHSAYSRKAGVNRLLGYLANIIGGSATNWKIQHNVLHHSFTNVEGMDEDIAPGIIMRFSPHQRRYKLHRVQHLYAWFFYGVMTLSWAFSKDFRQLFRYRKMGLINGKNKNTFGALIAELLLTKVFYYAYTIALPIILLPTPWWLTVICFITMHFVAGFVLACIFQSAHVMPTSEYPLPDQKGNLENNWAIHQLLTTTNFSPSSKIFSWYIGGLNYQIEHHLFPNICHIHYKSISNIVKETAQEFGLPYNSQPNFVKALLNHSKMLRTLGKYDEVKPVMA